MCGVLMAGLGKSQGPRFDCHTGQGSWAGGIAPLKSRCCWSVARRLRGRAREDLEGSKLPMGQFPEDVARKASCSSQHVF